MKKSSQQQRSSQTSLNSALSGIQSQKTTASVNKKSGSSSQQPLKSATGPSSNPKGPSKSTVKSTVTGNKANQNNPIKESKTNERPGTTGSDINFFSKPATASSSASKPSTAVSTSGDAIKVNVVGTKPSTANSITTSKPGTAIPSIAVSDKIASKPSTAALRSDTEKSKPNTAAASGLFASKPASANPKATFNTLKTSLQGSTVKISSKPTTGGVQEAVRGTGPTTSDETRVDVREFKSKPATAEEDETSSRAVLGSKMFDKVFDSAPELDFLSTMQSKLSQKYDLFASTMFDQIERLARVIDDHKKTTFIRPSSGITISQDDIATPRPLHNRNLDTDISDATLEIDEQDRKLAKPTSAGSLASRKSATPSRKKRIVPKAPSITKTVALHSDVKHSIQPKRIEFGAFRVGERCTIPVSVTNKNLRVTRFRADVDDPFLVVPAVSNLVPPGMPYKFDLNFTPQNLDDFSTKISITGNDGSSTEIPIDIRYQYPQFSQDPVDLGVFPTLQDSHQKSFKWNNIGKHGKVSITLLHEEGQISLMDTGARQVQNELELRFELKSDVNTDINCNLEISYENNKKQLIGLRAKFDTPRLSLIEDSTHACGSDQLNLQLTKQNIRSTGKQTLHFKNESAVQFSFETLFGSNFKVSPSKGVFAPAEIKEFKIGAASLEIGMFRREIKIVSNGAVLFNCLAYFQCAELHLSVSPGHIPIPSVIKKHVVTLPLELVHDACQDIPYSVSAKCSNGTASITPAIGKLSANTPCNLTFNLDPEYGHVEGVVAISVLDKHVTLPFQTNIKIPPVTLTLSKNQFDFGLLECGIVPSGSLIVENPCPVAVEWKIETNIRKLIVKPEYGILMPNEKIDVDLTFEDTEDERKVLGTVKLLAKHQENPVVAAFGVSAIFAMPSIEISPRQFSVDIYPNYPSNIKLKLTNQKAVPAVFRFLPFAENGLSLDYGLVCKTLEPGEIVNVDIALTSQSLDTFRLDPKILVYGLRGMKSEKDAETISFRVDCNPLRTQFEAEMGKVSKLMVEKHTDFKTRELQLDNDGFYDLGSAPIFSRLDLTVILKNPNSIPLQILSKVDKYSVMKRKVLRANEGNTDTDTGFQSKSGKQYLLDKVEKKEFIEINMDRVGSDKGFAIGIPENIELNPNETREIPVILYNNQTGPFQDSVTFSSNNITFTFNIKCKYYGCPVVPCLQEDLVKFSDVEKRILLENKTPQLLKIYWDTFAAHEDPETINNRPITFTIDYRQYASTNRLIPIVRRNVLRQVPEGNKKDAFVADPPSTFFPPYSTQVVTTTTNQKVSYGMLTGTVTRYAGGKWYSNLSIKNEPFDTVYDIEQVKLKLMLVRTRKSNNN